MYPSIRAVKAGGSSWVQSQTGLHRDLVSKEKTQLHTSKLFTMIKLVFIPETQGYTNWLINIIKSYKWIWRQKLHDHLNRCKKRGGAFDKIQHSSIKGPKENRVGRNIPQYNKSYYDKSIANNTLNREKLEAILFNQEQGCPLSPLLFQSLT